MESRKVNISKLVGRSYDQADCWDTAREFYMLVFQVELKHYYSETPHDRKDIKNLIYTNRGDFEEVIDGSKRYGDILLFKIHGVESHLGVDILNGQFLHSSKKAGSCIDRMERWEKMLVGRYRHRGLLK